MIVTEGESPAQGHAAARILQSALCGLAYLAAHVWLFLAKPQRFLEIEIALQLLLLIGVIAGIKRQTGGEERVVVARGLLIAILILFTVLGLAVNRMVTEGRLISDETAYAFESRIFASGHLTAPAPPAGVVYEHHIINAGRWFTKFPPGWPAVLAASSAVSLDGAINILLGVAILGLGYCIAKRAYSEREAGLALLFMLLSPAFFCNCLGLMSHPLCGCLLACAALFYFRAREGAIWNGAVMLAAVALATLVRPLTAIVFGLVLGVALLWDTRREHRRLWAMLLLSTVFGAAAIGLNGAYNYAMTGSFAKFPYAMFSGTAIPMEMIPRWSDALRVLRWSLVAEWAFAFPLLFPAAGFALFCDREKRREGLLLCGLFLALVAGYTPNRFTSGSLVGERWYYEAFFALTILAARGVVLLEKRWGGRQLVVWLLAPCAASAFATFVIFLPAVLHEAAPYSQIRRLAAELPFHHATVFLQTRDPEFIAKHFNLNSANWPTAPVFFAPDPGAATRQALADALGRPSWVLIAYDPTNRTARVIGVHR